METKITRKHFRSNKMFSLWESIAKRNGFDTVHDFIEAKYFREKLGMIAISKMVGCSHIVLHQIFKDAGITYRNKGGSKKGSKYAIPYDRNAYVRNVYGRKNRKKKNLCVKCGAKTANRLLCENCFRNAPTECAPSLP